MAEPENRLFCRLDCLTPAAREQKRLVVLKSLGLLEAEAVAVFDEATQTAAEFLDAPICILSIMTPDWQLIKSAVGLSRIGLMNQLAQSRQLPRSESFCTYVVDSHQVLAIHDTAANSLFASSLLVGHYGIRAYLGAPLLTTEGQCLGTLAVMDLEPRSFSSRDSEFLAMTARWSLSEFQRNQLVKHANSNSWWLNSPIANRYETGQISEATPTSQNNLQNLPAPLFSTSSIKLKLLSQLTQELRTPLTSIMGMASVLNRQIYGSLTSKQQEYLEIIHQSGQHLVSLVEEIVTLGFLDEASEKLHLNSVDIEMLCQQAINSLLESANQRQQQLRLSVEPGNRIWLLDKEKVRQMLYYLLFSVLHSAEAGSEIRIHVSRKTNYLNIAVWVSHPWLGDGLPVVYGGMTDSLLPPPIIATGISVETNEGVESSESVSVSYLPPNNQPLSSISLVKAVISITESTKASGSGESREHLGLLLSCHLAELHRGKISIQGLSDSGSRYVITLPQLEFGVDPNRGVTHSPVPSDRKV
ncbi:MULTISPECIES: GAF domain-containing sensor histidine kinase [unclassified Coleofasciculus]|uniref:GAF domain-containing sensor histidine kinase n=1 Tax=unclassified Coleofasciculus TaxID=2692782 RepID=UPI00188284DD|nr:MULTISPECIES: GAF domain-containing sensor histidine kinase [unclassified Coleofasciculus]MBE9124653.1 GAF domain-containing sensor histidine kinase [Coleofasciculus sp. LEGE 07081]MBE9146980.1 GAF domain-containing sensor histidine kinase [Coleofasciculus sp. LEGE 07092]